MQGSIGGQIQNFSNIFGGRYLTWLNTDSFVDEFHGGSPNAGSTTISGTDYYTESATYVALRDVSLGFRIPKRKLRVYASGRNMLFFMGKGYHGINPEYAALGNSASIFSKGEQRVTTTALLRTLTLGLSLDF